MNVRLPLPRIIFARHGATEWNTQRRYIGHTDQPLNALGKSQAAELGGVLASVPLDAIYCSDLRRACETSCAVRRAVFRAGNGQLPILKDARLREIDFGRIEGLTYEEAMARFPEEMTRWYAQTDTVAPPGGRETLSDVRGRVCDFMKEVSERDYRTILIVTHGGVINTWLAQIGKKPFWDKPLRHGEWMECEGQGGNEAE